MIAKVKAHFARYGVPDTVVSDNGPPFKSDAFAHFAQKWGFEHTPSSPYHSRSNGKAEYAVKAAKRMLKKAKRSGEDQYLALLNIRNTPTQGVDSSPAQRFLGRRTKTTLPTSAELLEFRNAVTRPEAEQLLKLQKRQAKYYNQNTKDLPPLETGDTVRMKPFRLGSDTWEKATVTERLDDRSYQVMTNDGAQYRRNHVHLRKSLEPSGPSSGSPPEATPVAKRPSEVAPQEVPQIVSPQPVRKSQRDVKTPVYFKDYVMH